MKKIISFDFDPLPKLSIGFKEVFKSFLLDEIFFVFITRH